MVQLSVGVRELKTHLSKYLREVKLGKTIVITDHGKPVGRLGPAETSIRERLEALREAGIITWSGKDLVITPPTGAVIGTVSVSDLLIEDRE
ncbi:MAG TPA: type II toxin-antitoxin system prevent-host-death family antitoxin [Anaerolineae bacterium]